MTTPTIPAQLADGGGFGSGVTNNPDGGVSLGSAANFKSDFAYLSNSGQRAGSSFVSRVNTKTGLEEARYPSVLPLDNNGVNLCTAGQPSSCLVDLDVTYFDNAPSRTVVDLNGGVFVANRGQCDWQKCTADVGNVSYNPNNPDGTTMLGAVQGSVTYIANRVDHPEQCTPRCQNRQGWNLPDGGAAIFSSGSSLPLPDGGTVTLPSDEVISPSPADGDAGALLGYAPDLVNHPCLDNGAHSPTDVTDPTNYDDCARFTIPLGAPNGYDLKTQHGYADRFAPRGLAISKNCGSLNNALACDLYVGLTEPAAESSQIIHLGFQNNFQVANTIDTGVNNYALYGAAIDCDGVLWAGHGNARVGLNTADDTLMSTWTYKGNDGGPQEVTHVVDSTNYCTAYGVAVDLQQHVWTGQIAVKNGSNVGACAFDYGAFLNTTSLHDGSLSQTAAQAIINGLFTRFTFRNTAGKFFSAGITVDQNNVAYLVFNANPGVIALDFSGTGTGCGVNGDSNCLWSQNGSSFTSPLANAWGIDLDQDGNPVVSLRSAGILGLSAATGAPLPTYPTNGTHIGGPNGGDDLYTYSDFTGYALRQITQPGGVYEQIFTGCTPPENTSWLGLTYTGQVPPGASIYFQIDSATDLAAFSNSSPTGPQILGTWTCNSASSCASPATLTGLPGTYARVTAKLVAPACTQGQSPQLDSMQLSYKCSPGG